MRFLPLYRTLPDYAAKAGKSEVNGGTPPRAVSSPRVPNARLAHVAEAWVLPTASAVQYLPGRGGRRPPSTVRDVTQRWAAAATQLDGRDRPHRDPVLRTGTSATGSEAASRALPGAPGTTEAAVANPRSISEHLRLVHRELANSKGKVARLIESHTFTRSRILWSHRGDPSTDNLSRPVG